MIINLSVRYKGSRNFAGPIQQILLDAPSRLFWIPLPSGALPISAPMLWLENFFSFLSFLRKKYLKCLGRPYLMIGTFRGLNAIFDWGNLNHFISRLFPIELCQHPPLKTFLVSCPYLSFFPFMIQVRDQFYFCVNSS